MMKKRTIWGIGCTICLLLGLCTVFSYKIQEMMLVKVIVTNGTQINEREREYPISCLGETKSTLFYVEKEKGFFQEEYVVKEKEVTLTEIREDSIVILGENFWASNWELPNVVSSSTHELEVGDVVKVLNDKGNCYSKGENCSFLKCETQEEVLLWLGFIALTSIVLLVFIWKNLMDVYDGKREKLKCALFYVGLLLVVVLLFNFLEIPRELLPKDTLFDLEFWKRLYSC